MGKLAQTTQGNNTSNVNLNYNSGNDMAATMATAKRKRSPKSATTQKIEKKKYKVRYKGNSIYATMLRTSDTIPWAGTVIITANGRDVKKHRKKNLS